MSVWMKITCTSFPTPPNLLGAKVWLSDWQLQGPNACVHQVCAAMNEVPYHNFQHVCEVTHSCYRFLRLLEGSCAISAPEQLALLLAAVCHDMGHLGASQP